MTMTDRPEVMILHPLAPDAMTRLQAAYCLQRWDQAQDKADFLARHGAHCRAAVTSGHTPLTESMLTALPALELVCCSSAGYDSLSLAPMAARGIALTNTSAALQADVADTAIMLMLAARRSLIVADSYVRSGDWGRQGMFPLQHTVFGTRLGIVGMGSLGGAVAARAQAMGMRIAYWNRRAKDMPWTHQPDLIQLARDSDTLILTVAGGRGTEGLISAPVLRALGPQGLLVNIARGSVVDEAALIAALTGGELGHAALDVFASEPDPDPHLTALPNVTLFPHHASGTVESRAAMSQLVLDNLAAFFAGRDLISAIDYDRR
ncbi:2-hydroxyacid dehydrogenase [Paracoccus sp. (in: a-proteobacteria)]|uniref:2-hydroxyacid dehydrogenase n=1 Tax=Paracoccus sp. TaxID=267 RepID=UPI003A8718EE